MSTSLKTLVTKLDDTCRAAAERAAAITMARGHHEVDIEHVLLALLEVADSDVGVLCRRFDVSTSGLTRDLERELQGFKTGNTRTPVFSSRLPTLFEHAWLIASLDAARRAHPQRAPAAGAADRAGAGADRLSHAARCSRRFDVDQLKHKLDDATRGSREARQSAAPRGDGEGADDQAAPAMGATHAGARPVHDQPHAARARRQDRSGDRPRGGDPPGHRHPDAPPPEQSDPDRRGRRRQDRGGRRPRAAHRRGRRARSAEGRVAAHARPRACCRPAPASRASSRTG